MVEWLTFVYLGYMFVSLYFLFLFVLTFLFNRNEINDFVELDRDYKVSVLIPAYNEEESIEETIRAVLNIDYRGIVEIIVLNDGSTDGTAKIVRGLQKECKILRLVNKKNSGKADSLNKGIKIAKGELIAVVDSDSFPSRDSFSKMIGFLSEEGVGGVTTRVLVRHPNKFIEKLQAIEYKVIGFSRKMLGFLDAIYVTPGPLAIYQKSALEKIGGFDIHNMTEDIEVTWHLVFEGYKVKMSFLPYVTTVAPSSFLAWVKQRVRWNIGGFQTMIKYRKSFLRNNMLGFFILPFFTLSLFLGVLGLGIVGYRIFRRFAISYLSTRYSIGAETAILTLQEINLHPSIVQFFGVVLFVLGFLFIFLSLYVTDKKVTGAEGFFTIVFYSLVYMTLYPLVLMFSIYKFLTRTYSW